MKSLTVISRGGILKATNSVALPKINRRLRTSSCSYLPQTKRFIRSSSVGSCRTSLVTDEVRKDDKKILYKEEEEVKEESKKENSTNIFVAFWKNISDKISNHIKNVDSEAVNAQIKNSVKDMKVLYAILPMATMSNTNIFLIVTKAVASFIKMYLLLLFMRVLLSWFPTFRWDQNPWIILRQVTDPYLNLFRGLVPPLLGTIDFTPLLGFIILQWLGGALELDEEDKYW